MKLHLKKIFNCLAITGLIFISVPIIAEELTPNHVSEEIEITVIATSDMHGHLTGWKYEDNEDTKDAGFSRVATLVSKTRANHENTLVIDNGDTIQGTILTDELFNGYMDKVHPIIEIMNYIDYDAMTLGNHEFNFGIPYLNKLKDAAKFPFLSANIYDKETGDHYVEPYIIKEFDDVKVGILSLTIPSVPLYDGGKDGVLDYEYKHLTNEAQKYVEILETQEEADLIIVAVHAGLDDPDAIDDSTEARLIAESYPNIDILLVGHSHTTVNEVINDVLVGQPSGHREAVQFDIVMTKENDEWSVSSKSATIHKLSDFDPDLEAEKIISYADEEAKLFLTDTIGVVTDDFQPKNEISGLAEGYLQDSAVIDLINNVQLEATGADVSAVALFSSYSDLKAGDINYGDIFKIYKYPNTLVKVEVTGEELKNYIEMSANFYEQYEDGDLSIGFDPNIKTYNYDMFQGVDYKIDISQPAGSRIVDLMHNGQPLKDDDILTLAINDYRYSGIGPTGIGLISGENIHHDSTTSLRSLIREHIQQKGTISPEVDNNWEIIGNNWDEDLRSIAINGFTNGSLEYPGWPISAFTEEDLLAQLIENNAKLIAENEELSLENSELTLENAELIIENAELETINSNLLKSNQELLEQNEIIDESNTQLETYNDEIGELLAAMTELLQDFNNR
ncbi:MAG: hypothetical protein ATN31_11085 [Candidatus Epulonipiscioides saccharophilum]|nr:MAG: hypothetical protein ATN31_11085 [Epulopiscium sp. AS2M-Bin001]